MNNTIIVQHISNMVSYSGFANLLLNISYEKKNENSQAISVKSIIQIDFLFAQWMLATMKLLLSHPEERRPLLSICKQFFSLINHRLGTIQGKLISFQLSLLFSNYSGQRRSTIKGDGANCDQKSSSED